MKRLARYWINHEINWITASGVMMGVALFTQALYYFAFAPLEQISTVELVMKAILPMVLEATWCVLLRVVRLKPAFTFGVLGSVMCALLIAQALIFGSFFQILLSVIMYPIAIALLIIIVCGFFPYRLFGFVALAAVVVLRVFFFGFVLRLFRGQWLQLLEAIPGICMSAGLWFLFGGIRSTRIKKA